MWLLALLGSPSVVASTDLSRRGNLAGGYEIGAHLSGARNDKKRRA